MNIWSVLGIEPTNDVSAIKKAYRNQLKNNRPDDNESAFMAIREAYEEALEYVGRDMYDEYMPKYEIYEEECEGEREPVKYDEYTGWINKIEVLYNDYYKRNKVEEWKELLFNDIPYQFKYYMLCRNYILNYVCNRYERVYLPKEVCQLLDDFFVFSKKPMERAKSDEQRNKLTKLNQKLKICENIRFDKLNPHNLNGEEIDDFFCKFDFLVESFIKGNEGYVDTLMDYDLFYLPLECLYIYVHWDEFLYEEKIQKIEALNAAIDRELPNADRFETELLRAKLLIDSKEHKVAIRLVRELYMKVSTKDYLSLYLLSLCCKDTGMLYEAYMIIKQLTWLRPQPFLHEIAEYIYNVVNEQYVAMLDADQDMDDLVHIRMCRMYLRANKEEVAVLTLNRVKEPSKYQWEYEVAHAMCIFYEDSISVPSNLYVLGLTWDAEPPMEVEKAIPVFEILENYPKEYLGNIDKLEWQELQARYLFEQRRYSECDKFCNELLEEYPVSYPILTLRAYADYNANTYGHNGRFTEYMDLSYLLRSMPERYEIRLIIAQLYNFSNMHNEAKEIMSPLKDIYPDRYRWYELFCGYNDESDKNLLQSIHDIMAECLKRKLDIPPVSKYKLLDLRNVMTYTCRYGNNQYSKDEAEIIYPLYKSLIDSPYNNPEKFIEWTYFYSFLDMDDKAVEYIQNKIDNVSEREKARLYNRLVILSDSYDDIEKYSQYITDKAIIYRGLGYAALDEKKYELAIKHLEKAVACNDGLIDLYEKLAYAYLQVGRCEDSIKAYEMGIRVNKINGKCGNINCYIELANVYIRLKQYDKCLKWLEKGKKYYDTPDILGRYYYILGFCYSRMDEKKHSKMKIAAWYKMTKYRYDDILTYSKLADCYVENQEYERAIEVLEAGIEVDSSGDYYYGTDGFGNLYYDIYIIYCDKIVDYNKAIEFLELMRKNTQNEHYRRDYIFRLGLVYSFMEDEERMKDTWLKAVELKHTYPIIYGKLYELYQEPRDKLEILLKGIDIIKGCADYGDSNLYESLYFVYMELGEYYNAYVAALNLVENTRDEQKSMDGYQMAGTAALVYERPDIANELYQKEIDALKEKGEEIPHALVVNNLIALYNLRKPEAKNVALSILHTDGELNIDWTVLPLRAEYMATGYIDKELAMCLHDEVVALIGQEEPKEIYENLLEIAAALSDDEKIERYKAELLKHIDSWKESYVAFAWCYIYRGDLKKALEIYEKDDDNKTLSSNPTGYAEYEFIKEMIGKRGEKL